MNESKWFLTLFLVATLIVATVGLVLQTQGDEGAALQCPSGKKFWLKDATGVARAVCLP